MTSTTEELPACPICASTPDRCDCFEEVVDPTPADRRRLAALALEHAGEPELAEIVEVWHDISADRRQVIAGLIMVEAAHAKATSEPAAGGGS